MFWSDFNTMAMLASKMSCEAFYFLLYSERDYAKLLLILKVWKLVNIVKLSEICFIEKFN